MFVITSHQSPEGHVSLLDIRLAALSPPQTPGNALRTHCGDAGGKVALGLRMAADNNGVTNGDAGEDVVRLNIGGTRYTTTTGTLTEREPEGEP